MWCGFMRFAFGGAELDLIDSALNIPRTIRQSRNFWFKKRLNRGRLFIRTKTP